MAFYGYSIMRSNIFNASFHEDTKKWELSEMFDVVRNIMKENKSGDVITVFEDDTEYNGDLLFSWFNDPINGWYKDFDRTNV